MTCVGEGGGGEGGTIGIRCVASPPPSPPPGAQARPDHSLQHATKILDSREYKRDKKEVRMKRRGGEGKGGLTRSLGCNSSAHAH